MYLKMKPQYIIYFFVFNVKFGAFLFLYDYFVFVMFY